MTVEEVNFEMRSVQVSLEIEQVYFDVRPLSLVLTRGCEGWATADIDEGGLAVERGTVPRGSQNLRIEPIRQREVHAVGKGQLTARLEVGRGKAEAAAAAVSRDALADDRVIPSSPVLEALQISVLNSLPEKRARDALAVLDVPRTLTKLDSEDPDPLREVLEGAEAIVPDCAVEAQQQPAAAEGSDEDTIDELLGGPFRQRPVELQRERDVDSPALQEKQAMPGTEDAGGARTGEDLPGVRVEGHDDRLAVHVASPVAQLVEEVSVPLVESVEEPDGRHWLFPAVSVDSRVLERLVENHRRDV